MVDILKSNVTSSPFSDYLVMFFMVHELKCNIKVCFIGLWMMMSVGCSILVQLAGMNSIRICGCLLFTQPRNSFHLCSEQ